jgi:hypothetical protein
MNARRCGYFAVMLTFQDRSKAAPERVWPRLAEPRNRPRRAPHVRRAEGLGEPEVLQGLARAHSLAGLVPVPLSYRVQARDGGAQIDAELRVPPALERTLGLTWGPAFRVLLCNLARVASGVQ